MASEAKERFTVEQIDEKVWYVRDNVKHECGFMCIHEGVVARVAELQNKLNAAEQQLATERERHKSMAADYEKIAKGEHPLYVMRCDVPPPVSEQEGERRTVEHQGKRYRFTGVRRCPAYGEHFWHHPSHEVWRAEQDYSNNAYEILEEVSLEATIREQAAEIERLRKADGERMWKKTAELFYQQVLELAGVSDGPDGAFGFEPAIKILRERLAAPAEASEGSERCKGCGSEPPVCNCSQAAPAPAAESGKDATAERLGHQKWEIADIEGHGWMLRPGEYWLTEEEMQAPRDWLSRRSEIEAELSTLRQSDRDCKPAPAPAAESGKWAVEAAKVRPNGRLEFVIYRKSGELTQGEADSAADFLNRRAEIESQLAQLSKYKRDAEAWEKQKAYLDSWRNNGCTCVSCKLKESFAASLAAQIEDSSASLSQQTGGKV